MHVSDFCNRAVVTCHRKTHARELSRIMRDHHVGDVVVIEDCEGGVRPVGLVTDRDLAVQVMAAGTAPEHHAAEDLMAATLHTVTGSDTAYDAIWLMRSQGVRRLPVVDVHMRLIGIVTVDDVVDFLAQELSAIARVPARQVQREQARRSDIDAP